MSMKMKRHFTRPSFVSLSLFVSLQTAHAVFSSSTQNVFPILAPIGPAELVWNQSSDRCPGKNSFGHIGEQPDSVPIAWHNPLTNTTQLIASTSWGTFSSNGPSLAEARLPHDCSHRVFTAMNLSTPWSYANHQVRMHK